MIKPSFIIILKVSFQLRLTCLLIYLFTLTIKTLIAHLIKQRKVTDQEVNTNLSIHLMDGLISA